MRDIRSPEQKQTHKRYSQSSRIQNTAFVVSEVRSPQDVRIDRQLQSIFNRLNQSYSTSINTPHTAFLQQQLDDFLQLSQTVFLFSNRTATDANGSASISADVPGEDHQKNSVDAITELLLPVSETTLT